MCRFFSAFCVLVGAIIALTVCAPTGLAQRQNSEAPLTNADIISMTKAGLSADVIIAKIAASRCNFDTSPSALERLKSAGVPSPVILAVVNRYANPVCKAWEDYEVLEDQTVELVRSASSPALIPVLFKAAERRRQEQLQKIALLERTFGKCEPGKQLQNHPVGGQATIPVGPGSSASPVPAKNLSTQPANAPSAQAPARASAAPSASVSRATIVFYCPWHFSYSALRLFVYLDRQPLGQLPVGRYFSMEVSPGNHEIESNIKRLAPLHIELAPGQSIYITILITRHSVRMVPVPATDARKALERLKPADTKPTLVTALAYRIIPHQSTTYLTTPGYSNTTCYGEGLDTGYLASANVNCQTFTTPPTTAPITVRWITVYNALRVDSDVYVVTCTAHWIGSACSSLIPGDIFTASLKGNTMWVLAWRGGNRGRMVRIKFRILDVRPVVVSTAQSVSKKP